jgi:hypothetical protein
MVNTEDRLTKAAIELPPAVTPFGPYLAAVQTGNFLFLSGMLPTVGHEPKFLGRIGKELNIEQGRGAASPLPSTYSRWRDSSSGRPLSWKRSLKCRLTHRSHNSQNERRHSNSKA